MDLPSVADLWTAVRARPQLAPAALALAAVGRYGESAREEADWLRRTYPRVPSDRLARVAVRSAALRARYASGTTLLGGPLGAFAGVSTLTWTQARLVIDIAAIMDHDPNNPARAADVLTLLGVYADPLSAGKAVAELVGDVTVTSLGQTRPANGFTGSVTTHLGLRFVGRLVPGATVLMDALRSTADTQRLAERTIRHYRAASATS
jgi:hypothetical protein